MTSPPSAAQVVIIGGGIIGCSTAYHLARAGLQGHRPARARQTHQRLDLACRRPGRPAAHVRQHDAASEVQRRAVRQAGSRRPARRPAGSATAACASPAIRSGWSRSSARRPPPTASDWKCICCRRRRRRRCGRSWTAPMSSAPRFCRPTARPILPTSRRRSPRARACTASRSSRIARSSGFSSNNGRVSGVATSHGRDPDRDRRQLRGTVGQADRATRRRQRTAGLGAAPVHRDRADRRRAARTCRRLRDPDRLIYFKEEVGGLVMGGYEPNPIPWAEHGIPEGFEFQLLSEDWDHFEPIMTQALARVPALENAGIKQLINGPESFTPDGNFILGEAPEVQRLLRRRRLQRLRHRIRRRRRAGAGRVDRRRRAAHGLVAGRHPPLRPPPSSERLGAHAHARGLRQALHDGLAVRGVSQRAARCACRRSTSG